MLPRVFEIVQNGERPVMEIELYRGMEPINGTSLQAAKLWMESRDESATLKLNGVAVTIVAAGPPCVVRYTWQTGDTDTVMTYNSWLMLYWGVGFTLPEYITGPEIIVFKAGTRLIG